ncbi:hypothetical protein Ancab_032403 [Ancistrocladus abbreviatus]
MEGVRGLEEAEMVGSQMSSAASFVEGGIQESCDDACSICLEDFSKSDPSTTTYCRHEFHLQCILEWAQRSSQCPMCWQAISMKDPVSQELFEAVEQERNFRIKQSRSAAIFHPTFGQFDLQHLPMDERDVGIEERIIQRLATAAGIGRGHHISRRESPRTRSSLLGRPQFFVYSAPNAPPSSAISSSSAHVGGQSEPVAPSIASASIPLTNSRDAHIQSISLSPVQTDQNSLVAGSSAPWANTQVLSENQMATGQSSIGNEDRAGPSDFQSFSESLKSRFSAMSMRESFSRSTSGWKEKWFARSTSMADLGSEVQREVNAGIATVSRMLERFDSRENNRARRASVSNNAADWPNIEQRNQNNSES